MSFLAGLILWLALGAVVTAGIYLRTPIFDQYDNDDRAVGITVSVLLWPFAAVGVLGYLFFKRVVELKKKQAHPNKEENKAPHRAGGFTGHPRKP